jgi:uncharacterized protein YkwD
MSRSLSLLIALAVVIISFTLQVNALSSKTIQTIVKKHNRFRAKHHAPPLKWDKTLARYAQKWSNKCEWEHSNGPYGENLAMDYPTWSSVVDGWYGEVKDYNYNNPGFSLDTGHFTAVVWKSTTKIGCGVKTCRDKKIYTCSYAPFGNVMSNNNEYFIENVLAP